MVGVQHQGHVEGAAGRGAGALAAHHEQEVGCVVESLIGSDGLEALPTALNGCRERGELRGEPRCFGPIRRRRHVLAERVQLAEGRDRGTQRRHGRRLRRGGGDLIENHARHRALARQHGGEIGQLRTRGQLAFPQQIGRFFEGRVLGEIVDVVTAVGEQSLLAVDDADARAPRDDALEPGGCCA